MQIQEYRAGHQAVWFRGIKQRYNNKVLWLIDGVPLRDSYYGRQAVDEAVPLEMVERIEVITGPGSVLYGTNAFAGGRQHHDPIGSGGTRRPQRARLVRVVVDRRAAVEAAAGPVYAYVDHLATAGFSPALSSGGKAWAHSETRKRTYSLFKAGGSNLAATLSVFDHH